MRSILTAIGAALLVALLATQIAPVRAQNNVKLDAKQKSDEAEAKEKDRAKKDIDNGYKSAVGRMPDQKLDPWRNMR